MTPKSMNTSPKYMYQTENKASFPQNSTIITVFFYKNTFLAEFNYRKIRFNTKYSINHTMFCHKFKVPFIIAMLPNQILPQ